MRVKEYINDNGNNYSNHKKYCSPFKPKIQAVKEKAILLQIPLIRFLTWMPLQRRKELSANF